MYHAAQKSFFLLTLIALGIVSLLSYRVLQAAEESIDTLIEDKEDALDEIKAKIKAYKQIIELKQRQGVALSDQIETVSAQVSALELEIDASKKELDALNEDIKTLTQRIEQKELVIVSQKKVLAEIMRGTYQDQSDLPLDILANASRFENPLQMSEWTHTTGQKIREVLTSLRTLRTSLIEERKSITDKKVQADKLYQELGERQSYLDEVKASKERLLSKTQSEAKKYDALVDDLEEQRKAIEDEIEDIESGKTAALDLKDVPKYQKGLLAYPVKDPKITQKYGKTTFTRWYTFHNGTDFGMPTGTKVLSAADGKVVALGNNGRYAYGRWIAVDHGNGLVTMYGHLSGYVKKVGDKVKKGDTIAKSGNTGYSTGPHLHFTVFSTKSFDVVPSKKIKSVKDIPVGATINPALYLP
jgi:murein DD-endopeptidase MepM/ murein hydrolase activator NlpD